MINTPAGHGVISRHILINTLAMLVLILPQAYWQFLSVTPVWLPPFLALQIGLLLMVLCVYDSSHLLWFNRTVLCTTFISFVIVQTVYHSKDGAEHYLLLLGIAASSLFFHKNEKIAYMLWSAVFAIAYVVLTNAISSAYSHFDTAKVWLDYSILSATLIAVVVLGNQSSQKFEKLKKLWREAKDTCEAMLPCEPLLQASPFSPGQSTPINHAYILFADLQGYKKLTETLNDARTVAFLHMLYMQFDQLATESGITRLKTNGDEYMAVLGLDRHPACQSQALRIAHFALAIRKACMSIAKTHQLDCSIRIGIASGPVTVGVIGQQHLRIDVWGKTVNVASSLESNAEQNEICVCETMHNQLASADLFTTVEKTDQAHCYATPYRLIALEAN